MHEGRTPHTISISCSFLGKFGKSYVGAPPGSATDITGGISVPGYLRCHLVDKSLNNQCRKNIIKCKKAYIVNNTGKINSTKQKITKHQRTFREAGSAWKSVWQVGFSQKVE